MLDSDVLAQFSCDAPDLHSITRIGQGAAASDAWQVPSSKSHSLRALLFGTMVGQGLVTHMLESADTMAMLTALRNLGAHWECLAPGCYYLKSYQPQNLAHAYTLDAGNSGQVARFLPVIALGLGFQDLTIRGDASLSSIRDFSVLGQT